MTKKENSKYRKEVYENNFEMELPCDLIIKESDHSLDKYFDRVEVNFLSEWFFDEKIHEYTNLKNNPFKVDSTIPTQYTFPDSNRKLNSTIEEFHVREGLPRGSFVVFISEGSTPMITAIILFAKQLGFKKICSIAPLYFTIHKVCDVLNMDILPCNEDLTYYNGSKISLPKKKSFLFITDPVWSIGRHHANSIFQQITEWQNKTKSIIFVDASFSYMDWGTTTKKEPSIVFDPHLTMRLICPTKTLCVHGLRFSYLLCPKEFSKEVARISISNTGSSCYFGHLQRERLFSKMSKEEQNPVGLFASKRFAILKEKFIDNNIEYIEPNCGFFMYANLDKILKEKGVRNKYYWLTNKALDIMNPKYKNWAKINLIMREKTINSLIQDLSK